MELYIKESWNEVDYIFKKNIDVWWDSVQTFRAHAITIHCVQGRLVSNESERGGVKGWGGVYFTQECYE